MEMGIMSKYKLLMLPPAVEDGTETIIKSKQSVSWIKRLCRHYSE